MRGEVSVVGRGFPAPRRTLVEIMAAHERLIIVEALARCGGSRTRAAAALGIRRERLYAKIRKHHIDLRAIEDAVGKRR